jgi:hypothetical protein
VKVGSITDPIVGSDAQVAFLLTASGVTAKEEAVEQLALPSIAYSSDGSSWSLLASVGVVAPGAGYWAGFTSLVLVKGAPLFTGLLKVSAAAGVTAASDLGSEEAITVNGGRKVVRTFTALAPAIGSIGAASGYDQSGDVEVLATFTDGSAGLVKVAAP